MDIKIADESDSKNWDKIVENSPHGTIFHNWKWLKIVEKHTKTEFYPLIALKGNNILGIFPFFHKKTFFNSLFSPPPHAMIPYLGPVIVDYENAAQDKKESRLIEFQTSIDEFISQNIKPKYLMIMPTPFLIDSRPFEWAGYQIRERYRYSVDFSNNSDNQDQDNVDNIWGRINTKTRQNIRRAERNGLSVEFGNKKEFGLIYDLIVNRYKDQNKVVGADKKLLLDLYESYSENIKIIVAKYKGSIVSGVIDIWHKDRALSWIGNPKVEIKGVSVNDALNWECMKMAHENGLKNYDIAGIAGNQRLYKFHSKYNPNFSTYFSAVKYSSITSKLAEYSYINLLKPLYSKFKSKSANKNSS